MSGDAPTTRHDGPGRARAAAPDPDITLERTALLTYAWRGCRQCHTPFRQVWFAGKRLRRVCPRCRGVEAR